jgi:hypothetical protein
MNPKFMTRDQMSKRIAELERDKENLLGICGDPRDKVRIICRTRPPPSRTELLETSYGRNVGR